MLWELERREGAVIKEEKGYSDGVGRLTKPRVLCWHVARRMTLRIGRDWTSRIHFSVPIISINDDGGWSINWHLTQWRDAYEFSYTVRLADAHFLLRGKAWEFSRKNGENRVGTLDSWRTNVSSTFRVWRSGKISVNRVILLQDFLCISFWPCKDKIPERVICSQKFHVPP